MCSLPLSLTVGAEPEKIQPMTGDLKPCFRNEFPGHALEALQIRVNDFLAFGADEMRMGVGSVPVIAVASFREPQLQHLVQFLEKGHSLVNRGQACRRKALFHLFVDVLYTRVSLAGSQDPEHGYTLRRDSGIVLLQSLQHPVVTLLLTSHALWINLASVMENDFP